MTTKYTLGSLEAAEDLLRDLYVSLRASLRQWARVTFQTPQARMGYVGQHLTSVVTGYPGGRSGARGKDLVLPGGKHAEIKTCYRVDQLGKCKACGATVASIEAECANCGSNDLLRNDDSKWLIGVRNEDEMRTLFDSETYYLVLFDFEDLAAAADINARIYAVDPKCKGFAYCMVDYYANIAPSSTAPFNLWPFQLKFEIMKPTLIYHARIAADDTISTMIFPNVRGTPTPLGPRLLTDYARGRNLDEPAVRAVATTLDVDITRARDKRAMLTALEYHRRRATVADGVLADAIAEALYAGRIMDHRHWLPASIR